MTDELKQLSELAAQLPKGLRSDWKNTNHYELHAPESKGEYFWWDLEEVQDPTEYDTQSTLAGQRLGLLMDIAEEVARLRDNNILK
jgi:hypothetical protein